VHSSLTWPRSSTAFDPTMLMQTNLRNPPFRIASTSENDAPNKLQQPSTPSRFHPHGLLARISSRFPRSQLSAEETEFHTVTPSRSRPNAVMDLASSLFRSQHRVNEEIELSQRATRLHVVDVAPMQNREVCIPLVSASGI
ncbi:hypothetical protein P692DRAFT_20758958, partial [Suillus brevipes Sb2]